MRLLLVVALIACSGGSQPRGDAWFAERGRRAQTWYPCTLIGASLRATCAGDRACESSVTVDLTRPCYAARYRATSNAGPTDKVDTAAGSPCGWQDGNPDASSIDYARRTCERVTRDPALRPHCVAELRMVIEDLCLRGSTELTGAGP